MGDRAATAISATGTFCFPKYSHNDPAGGPRSYCGHTAGCVSCTRPRPHCPQGHNISSSHPMSSSSLGRCSCTEPPPISLLHPTPPAQQLCRNHHHFIAAVAAAFWAPSAKPLEGCNPQFSPTWALCFVSGGPGTPFLGSSPVPWPSPPGLWGRFGSGVGSSGSPWHAMGQHCGCSGHAGSSKPWHGAGPCGALKECPPPHPRRP